MPDLTSNARRLIRVASAASRFLTTSSAHVWRLSCQSFLSECDEMLPILDDGEKARVESFRAERHKREFLIARALLRTLIAGYNGCAPDEVQFQYGLQGKPSLISGLHLSKDLAFNMSHSGDVILIGITLGIGIGVDIEQISSGVLCAEAISRICINSHELPTLHRMCDHDKSQMLLRYWTHKEAYLKAIGCGLSLPPHRVTVRFLNLQRSIICQELAHERQSLFGHDLPLGSDYTGAIVGPIRIQELRYFSI